MKLISRRNQSFNDCCTLVLMRVWKKPFYFVFQLTKCIILTMQTMFNYNFSCTSIVLGTYRWLAPEVFKEEKLSPASDIFSYGIVVWQLQTCEVPYKELTQPETIMYKVGLENMRPPIPDDCPEDIKIFIQQCWDARRENRPIIDEAIVALCKSKRAGEEL